MTADLAAWLLADRAPWRYDPTKMNSLDGEEWAIPPATDNPG